MIEDTSLAPSAKPTLAASGVFTGLLVILAIVNAAVGVPVLLLYLVASSGFRIPRSELAIAALIAVKLAWIVAIFFLYDRAANAGGTPIYEGGTPFAALLPTATVDVMLLAFLAIEKRNEQFLRSLAAPLFGLLLVDLAFNLYSTVFGADPLGRAVTQRADDIIPRMGGVFGHAFQSINVSVVAILLAWHFRRRLWLALGLLNVAINGSFRGVLAVAVMAVVYVVLRRRLRFGVLVAALTAVAASVFGVTILSVAQSELAQSGNLYRIFAWQNALDVIAENPLVGFHGFQFGDLEGVDFNSIVNFGIAESTYLNYAMRFGVFAAVAHLAIVVYFLARRTTLLGTSESEAARFNMTAAVFAGTLFVDTFYGSILGSVLPTVIFGFFCVSVRAPRGAPAASPRPAPVPA